MPATVDIGTLQKEALRLLRWQIGLIEEMSKVENLIVQDKGEEKQSFTQDSVRQDIEVLSDEVKKLERLVFVVAVVGTMKAGKSTAINAIVGTEVLPARSHPMTTVPTLIKHKPNTAIPVLRFENRGPVDDVMRRLGSALRGSTEVKLGKQMGSNAYFDSLVDSVKAGETFKALYEGAEIAQFLKNLNDLVRLARAADIDFPFDSYDSVENMPAIEVEFAHHTGSSTDGTLCLLDTPGPNESGQPHLQKVLQEQLRKASAVLVVLDCTQIGSDADEGVRSEIDKIAAAMDGRAYALINKLDQDEDGEARLRNISEELHKRFGIPEDHIFFVSAKQAYLSSRAKKELHEAGGLPDPDKEPWVREFGREAFGHQWEKKLMTNVRQSQRSFPKVWYLLQEFLSRIKRRKLSKEVRSAADHMWKRSSFGQFLEEVVQEAHQEAATLAIDSAASKHRHNCDRISNCLSIRGNALRVSAENAISDLEEEVRALQEESNRISDVERRAIGLADKIIKNVQKDLRKICSELQRKLEEAIDLFFVKGHKIDGEERDDGGTFLDRLIERLQTGVESSLFSSSHRQIEMQSKEEAEKLLKEIGSSVERIKKGCERDLKTKISRTIDDKIPSVRKVLIDLATEVEGAVNGKLKLDLRIRSPKLGDLQVKDIALKSFDDAVREKTYEMKRKTRRDSVWGRICEWFGTKEWGWEEHETEETNYLIDIEDVRANVKGSSQGFFDAVTRSVAKDVQDPLEVAIRKNCQELRDKVDLLRGDFNQSIQDWCLQEEPKKTLILEIERLFGVAKWIDHDLDGLWKDISAMQTPVEGVSG